MVCDDSTTLSQFRKPHLIRAIALEISMPVDMFLAKVQQNRNVQPGLEVAQLVTGEFDNPPVWLTPDIQHWPANIACQADIQSGRLQQMRSQ